MDFFAELLENSDAVITGANLPYDFNVMAGAFAKHGIDIYPALFAALGNSRVLDLQTSEALNAIAMGWLGRDPRTGGQLKNPETGKMGSYSLSMCVDLTLGRKDAKANDEWRKHYGELDGIPIEQWPQTARDYPVDDVRNSHEVALAHVGLMPKDNHHHAFAATSDGTAACTNCRATRMSAQCISRKPHWNLHEVANRVYSAFALSLGDNAGLYVDQTRVDIIEKHALKKRAAGIGPFFKAEILREDETENRSVLKKMIALAYAPGAPEPCPHCAGTGKMPSPAQAPLRCPDCKGRCQPWKAGGGIKEPTVANCARCSNTAKIPHPNPKLICCKGIDDEITCDGTGFLLDDAVPRAKKDGISFGRDTLHESGDEFLMSYGDFQEDAKVLKDYVPYLRKARVCSACYHIGDEDDPHIEGCAKPGWIDVKLTLKSNAVLETGRVSYRGYVQLFPRAPGYIYHDPETGLDQYIPSLRECFVARPARMELVEVPDDYQLQAGETLAC